MKHPHFIIGKLCILAVYYGKLVKIAYKIYICYRPITRILGPYYGIINTETTDVIGFILVGVLQVKLSRLNNSKIAIFFTVND